MCASTATTDCLQGATTATPENTACAFLRQALSKADLGGAVEVEEPYGTVLGFLEYFVTWVFQEARVWGDALDGIYVSRAVKVDDDQLLLLGAGTVMSTQEHIVLYVRVWLEADEDSIARLECGLGSPGQSWRQVQAQAELAYEDWVAVEWMVEARYG